MKVTERRTKIIITLGPASESESMLRDIILRGGNIFRLNMAHATHDWVKTICRRIRKVSAELETEVAIMMDVKGPEIRTGDVDSPILLKEGEIFDFTVRPGGGSGFGGDEEVRSVDVNYRDLINDIQVGDTVLVDNGVIRLEVLEKNEARIRCKVLTKEGKLTSRRHINLPGIKVNLPPLTEKDKADVLVGLEEGVDYFAQSFVRESRDITLLREFIAEQNASAQIIAKIEDQQAIRNLRDIIQICDALMVARGDLGIECPYEELPIIQRRAVKLCLKYGKPVIIATHMLESMINSPMPTRAEVTDVANAVFEQADCVMLSGETTVGKYPLDCVDVLHKIALRIERSGGADFARERPIANDKDRLLRSAAVMAEGLGGAGLLVFTRHGYLARNLAALRPVHSPIFAFTNQIKTLRDLIIPWGIHPFLLEYSSDPEEMVASAMSFLKRQGCIKKGDKLVVVTNMLVRDQLIDTVQMRVVE